jgi:hypothetical protein
MSRRREIYELPVRVARGPRRCIVCLEQIDYGEAYRDGGYPRRAHYRCAEIVARGDRRELTRAELAEVEAAEDAVSRAKGELYMARSERAYGVAVATAKRRVQQLAIVKANVRQAILQRAGG